MNKGITLCIVSGVFFLIFLTIIGLLLLPLYLGFWIWAMVDANNSTRDYNATRGLG